MVYLAVALSAALGGFVQSITGFGAAVVRNSNHFGVGGYYAMMAEREDMLGMCFTNTQAICVPTFGREVMLGTNPIAFAMPADPIPMLYDVATTVVPRGKLEVYAKQGKPMPLGWAVDENGKDTSDAKRVIDNINAKAGGGILPLGGSSPATGSHKGYGLALIVEILSSIIAGGATSNHVSKNGLGDTSQSFFALDYGMFGDKAAMRESLSTLLQELRDSAKAEGLVSVLSAPLMVNGKAIGILRVYSSEERDFTPDECDFMLGVANISAIAIENARMHEATRLNYELLTSYNYQVFED